MSTSIPMHGVVVVDKPTGMTSAKVVSLVKRGLGVKKIGHTGTLDPMATGVLPLCIGEGTKIAGYLLSADKHYEGDFVLGVETDTLDREGAITAQDEAGAARVTQEQVLAAMAALTGPIQRIPPCTRQSAKTAAGSILWLVPARWSSAPPGRWWCTDLRF